MPYIPQEKRTEPNKVIEVMEKVGIKADGDLNYILFKYCKDNVEPGYGNYKNFIAELNECATEIRRKLLAKHEDRVMAINGDV